MRTLIYNDLGFICLESKYGSEEIHINHCDEFDLKELSQDMANLYVIVEECANFPVLHLVSAFTECDAISIIVEDLNTPDEFHLIDCFEVTVKRGV